MSNQTGSFNITSSDSSNRYTLNDGNTGTIGVGVLLNQTTKNPIITLTFAATNTVETLTNSGKIYATADRAVYSNTVQAGDTINIVNTGAGVIEGAYSPSVSGKDNTSNNDDAIKIKATVTSGQITIDNSGLIQADSYTSIANTGVYGSTVSGQAIDMGDAVGFTIAITNESGGAIVSKADSAIKLTQLVTGVSSVNETVTNYGTITGGHHGVTGDYSITVTNSGTITGQLGSGINMDTTSGTTYVTNTGTITGTAGGTTDGDGIDVDYLLNLDNSGTISAVGTSTGNLNEAVTIGGGVILNESSGKIVSVQRAITVDNSNDGNAYAATTITNAGLIEGDDGEAIKITDDFADTLTNTGTIKGSVDLGNGSDVATNSGTIDGAIVMSSLVGETDTLTNTGTIDGSVTLGAGDDTLTNEGLITGGVDLGDGADTLVIGAGSSIGGAISGFTVGDKIDLEGVAATSVKLLANNVLSIASTSGTITLQLDSSVDYSGSTFTASSDGNGGILVENVICFYPGARIATPRGEVAVETLQSGDLVLTAEGAQAPIRWMGRQTVSTRFADPLRVLPIRIKAGALGENLPVRDLLVSPDHALLIEDVLVNAGALVNGASIVREADVPEIFTYWHIELADHALILAEGVPAETFIDNVDRMAFDNWSEHDAAHEPAPMTELPYPRAKSARQLPRAIRGLLARQGAAFAAAAVA
jgi:hypothetical protein